MFGINDDDKQDKPADESDDVGSTDAPTMPQPITASPSGDEAVNPITGSQTVGPPQVSSGLPSIIPGSGASPGLTKKRPLLSTLPQPVTTPPDSGTTPAPTSHEPSTLTPTPSMPDEPVSGDLLAIKKEVLQSLTPLVDQLDQPPDEKFKTLMMLLQASDNSDLVKDAYEAANKITDEKARARALLDVVNEINYFTQPKK